MLLYYCYPLLPHYTLGCLNFVNNFSDEVARMFESKDKDLDGRLSFEEFMGEASRAEKLFKLMDKDGDGYVTKHVSENILRDHSIMSE